MVQSLFTSWRLRIEVRRRIREELAFHKAAAVEENLAAGMTRDEALAEADARLGDRVGVVRACVAISADDPPHPGTNSPYAPRAFVFAAAALGPIALALALVPQYFRPYSQAAPERLSVSTQAVPRAFEQPLFDSDLAGFRRIVARIGGLQTPERMLAGRVVSANFFTLQGVQPRLGKTLSPSRDDEIVLSDSLWRDVFEGDPRAVGRTATVNGRRYTVVGVMARDYRFLDGFDRFWAVAPLHTRRPIEGHLLLRSAGGRPPPKKFRPISEVASTQLRAALGVPAAALLLLAFVGLAQTLSLACALRSRRVRVWVLIRGYLMLFAKAAPALGTLAVLWLALRESDALSPISYFSGVAAFLATFIFALLCVGVVWRSLVDQRLRCPMCLRKLTMPLPLGVIGSILFDLPGAEYICAYGHGTMYVPAPTSEGVRAPSWSEPHGMWADLVGVTPASRS